MRALEPREDSAEQAAPNDLGTVEEDAWDQWRSQLTNEGGEHRGAEEVLPNWETWRNRRGLPLTYSMTQVLTGHGVFGEYLIKIGRETTEMSPLQGRQGHGAAHAGVLSGVEAIPLHSASRHRRKIDPFGDRRSDAVRLFCERVMLAKERAERERKRNSHPCRITRWRGMVVRRPGAAPQSSQRAVTRGNGPLSAKLNS